jgi:hypothetical protein
MGDGDGPSPRRLKGFFVFATFVNFAIAMLVGFTIIASGIAGEVSPAVVSSDARRDIVDVAMKLRDEVERHDALGDAGRETRWLHGIAN